MGSLIQKFNVWMQDLDNYLKEKAHEVIIVLEIIALLYRGLCFNYGGGGPGAFTGHIVLLILEVRVIYATGRAKTGETMHMTHHQDWCKLGLAHTAIILGSEDHAERIFGWMALAHYLGGLTLSSLINYLFTKYIASKKTKEQDSRPDDGGLKLGPYMQEFLHHEQYAHSYVVVVSFGLGLLKHKLHQLWGIGPLVSALRDISVHDGPKLWPKTAFAISKVLPAVVNLGFLIWFGQESRATLCDNISNKDDFACKTSVHVFQVFAAIFIAYIIVGWIAAVVFDYRFGKMKSNDLPGAERVQTTEPYETPDDPNQKV